MPWWETVAAGAETGRYVGASGSSETRHWDLSDLELPTVISIVCWLSTGKRVMQISQEQEL